MTTSRIVTASLLVAALALAVMAPGCNILEEKTLDVILNSTVCNDPPFTQDSASEQFEDVAVVDIQRDLEQALDDNGYSTSDTASAELVGVSGQVLTLDSTHDWTISGSIQVEYLILNDNDPSDTTVVDQATLIDYNAWSLQAAMPAPVPAPLTPQGGALLNQVLDDFVKGQIQAPQRAVLRFTVQNGDVTPNPSQSDRIKFTWEVCLTINVILPQTAEVPNPF